MSQAADENGTWQARLAAAFERLVHPAISDAAQRARHGRLIGLLLAFPFLAGTLAAQLLFGVVALGYIMATACALFGAAWLAAIVVANGGRAKTVEAMMFVFGAVLIATAIAAAGLFKSPLFILLAALPFEARWLEKSRKSIARGWWAMALALAIALLLHLAGIGAGSQFGEHLWMVPICYAASIWFRIPGQREQNGARPMNAADLEELSSMVGTAAALVNPNGETELITSQVEKLLGVNPAALLGSGLFDRLHVTDRVLYLSALNDIQAGSERAALELRVKLCRDRTNLKKGSHSSFLFEFSRAPHNNNAVLVFIRDRRAIIELREAVKTAQDAADSIEIAKSRFLATVSHELRTPLNAIIGFSDMLKTEMFGPFADQRQKEYVELIGQSGGHLLSVVNAILDVSKIESGHYEIIPEPFAFDGEIDKCFAMMAPQAKAKKVTLSRDLDALSAELCADRRAVQQILINLVSNAIKFTPAGGRIDVSAGISDSQLVFRVRDNGIGMSPEELERVGRPFMQVNNAYTRQFEGTGLGLSLVKGLVALHEGSMHIDSAAKIGTTVTISLPLAGPGSTKPVEPGHGYTLTHLNAAEGENEKRLKIA